MGEVIWTTVRLAALTTALLLVIATPLAWWLARRRTWWKEVVAAIVTLPIILPPTVLGFYILIAVAPTSPLMAPLQEMFGIRTLAFTFEGLVLASIIYSLPFAVQPIRGAFESMGERPLEVAATLRASPLDAFFTVALPLARRGFLGAAILVFAHTVGEFGVVLMIGGSIPGETEVVSIRIYQLVESLNFADAHKLSAGLVAFAFAVLLALLLLDRRSDRRPL